MTRADGKLVNVARRPGHLFVCAAGCCCGHTEHGFAPVPVDLYHTEWERRKLRPHVHLSIGGCLGPCPLANVVMLLFDGRSVFFHSFNSERQVLALYDYIETLVQAKTYVPPPPALADLQFTTFNWEGHTQESVAFSDQPSAGGFVVLSHADTDLTTIARAAASLGPDFPPVRGYGISHLHSEDDARAFVDSVTAGADVLILRLLGGTGSFRGGFQRAVERAHDDDQWLICLPGTDTLDPELTAVSNVGAPVAHEALAYLQLGGVKNAEHLLRFLSDHLLTTGFGYDAPEPQPRHGVYGGLGARLDGTGASVPHDMAFRPVGEGLVPSRPAPAQRRGRRGTSPRPTGTETTPNADVLDTCPTAPQPPTPNPQPPIPTIGILFYRSHFLAENTAFVDALIQAVERRGASALAVYTSSLQDYAEAAEATREADAGASLPAALRYFVQDGHPIVDALITTTSFAAGVSDGPRGSGGHPSSSDPFAILGVPVVQAIAASTPREQWSASQRGLSPVDTAMNVAIPELDGRIISVPISFKTGAVRGLGIGGWGFGDASLYEPDAERADRAVGLALRLASLRRKANANKRVAMILTDYSSKASRIGGAVGLDTPASVIQILRALQDARYALGRVPSTGDELMRALIASGTHDRDEPQVQGPVRAIDDATYRAWIQELPEANQQLVAGRWGSAPGQHGLDRRGRVRVAGLDLGNVFVAIQPPRGYELDPAAIYHMPDLPPPHPYVAMYRWLATPQELGGWAADAIVHVGKHGTLEWLPGKGLGLSAECFPDALLGDLPMIYPFIINNPGEGAQAKRRAHSVVIDHLTPPMTTAEGYGEVEELSRLVDEYYQLEQLDPSKLPLLQQQIWELIRRARLDADLGLLLNRDSANHTHEWDPQFHEDGVPYTISDMGARDFAHLIENVNGYLCELTSAQIRDGLHILGQSPSGEQLVDTLFSLVRLPNLEVPSLRAGIASCFGLNLGALLEDLGRRIGEGANAEDAGQSVPGHDEKSVSRLERVAGRPLATAADALEAIDQLGLALLREVAQGGFRSETLSSTLERLLPSAPREARASTAATIRFVCEHVAPNLERTRDEIAHLLLALDGGHVPAGPSGAPTRGMAQVLPTGRNFYTVDPRGLPSAAAWTVGQQLAEQLVARYLADEGRYPVQVGISIWGTSLMRTHGDDVAQVMALIGVRPRWQAESRRLVGFEVIPLTDLGRPRIDVVCRISGFFRDAFPDLIDLLDRAFRTVAALDEPPEANPIQRHAEEARATLLAAGASPAEAATRSVYRVFGSPPGAYGAGILPLIDERNWQTDADLAQVYVNWGGYAYGEGAYGVDAREDFRSALARTEVAVKNQDNREHDIFDSDDYFQYHGGMIAAIRALAGRAPRRYFGDSADPERAKVRDLKEETLRVFRTRVVNPKWIASMQRHGYKGALELAATVDYLFGYDATANVVDDWMYERVATTYALDPQLQAFFRESNPWALRDLTGRLIEAMDRKLWEQPTEEMRRAIEATYLAAEADVEAAAARTVARVPSP